jgi:ribosome-associated translation inhibitor RaiA
MPENKDDLFNKIVGLRGFNLEETEIEMVRQIVEKQLAKIHREARIISLEISLKKVIKGKEMHGESIFHEIKTNCEVGGKKRLHTEAEDYNLLKAVDFAMEKLLNEIKHKCKEKCSKEKE